MTKPTETEIRSALDRAGINIPYYTADKLPNGDIAFTTRAGRIVVALRPVAGGEDGVDFSQIPGVGSKIDAALHQAGYHTLADLAAATDDQLMEDVQYLNAHVLARIRAFLAAHHG